MTQRTRQFSRSVITLAAFVLSPRAAAADESRLAAAVEKSDSATICTLFKQYADVNAPQAFAPTGPQQTSPGQRPGFVVSLFHSSPERAEQGPTICFALSELLNWFAIVTQGVDSDSDWYVIAPSGRCLSRT